VVVWPRTRCGSGRVPRHTPRPWMNARGEAPARCAHRRSRAPLAGGLGKLHITCAVRRVACDHQPAASWRTLGPAPPLAQLLPTRDGAHTAGAGARGVLTWLCGSGDHRRHASDLNCSSVLQRAEPEEIYVGSTDLKTGEIRNMNFHVQEPA